MTTQDIDTLLQRSDTSLLDLDTLLQLSDNISTTGIDTVLVLSGVWPVFVVTKQADRTKSFSTTLI